MEVRESTYSQLCELGQWRSERVLIHSYVNRGNLLVSWCFEPSQPQRITSGLNTNFTLSPGYSFRKPSYHKSCFFGGPIYIAWALNTGTCIRQGDLFYSAGLHKNHVLATANTEERGRGFGKNAGEWTGRVEIRKKSLAVTVACMAIY